MLGAIAQAVAAEGQPLPLPPDSIVGRWAGDRVVLVGDYDESKLWTRLPEYRNVTRELVDAWNGFMDLPDRKLAYNAECSCHQQVTA